MVNEEVYRARPLQDDVELTEELLLRMGPYLVDRPTDVFLLNGKARLSNYKVWCSPSPSPIKILQGTKQQRWNSLSRV